MTARLTNIILTAGLLIGVAGIIAACCGAPMGAAVVLVSVGLLLAVTPVAVGDIDTSTEASK